MHQGVCPFLSSRYTTTCKGVCDDKDVDVHAWEERDTTNTRGLDRACCEWDMKKSMLVATPTAWIMQRKPQCAQEHTTCIAQNIECNTHNKYLQSIRHVAITPKLHDRLTWRQMCQLDDTTQVARCLSTEAMCKPKPATKQARYWWSSMLLFLLQAVSFLTSLFCDRCWTKCWSTPTSWRTYTGIPNAWFDQFTCWRDQRLLALPLLLLPQLPEE